MKKKSHQPKPSISYTKKELEIQASMEAEALKHPALKAHREKVIARREEIRQSNPSYERALDVWAALSLHSRAANKQLENYYSAEIQLNETNTKRARGLKEKNDKKKLAIEHVKKAAQKLWKQNPYKKVRVGEMAEIVWAKIHDEQDKKTDDIFFESRAKIIDQLPDRASGLKSWLRDIAPAEARKPGRKPEKPTKQS
jgi:predicted nucleic acid-binding protein